MAIMQLLFLHLLKWFSWSGIFFVSDLLSLFFVRDFQ